MEELYNTVIDQIKNKPVDEWLSRFTSIVSQFNPDIVDAFLQDHDRLYRIMFDACLNETLREIYGDSFDGKEMGASLDNAWLLKALNPKVFNAVGSYVDKIESVKQWQAYTKAIADKLGRARVDGYREAFDGLYVKIYGVLIAAFQGSLREQLERNAYVELTLNDVYGAAREKKLAKDKQIEDIFEKWFPSSVKKVIVKKAEKEKSENLNIYDIVTDQIKTRPIEEWKISFVNLLTELGLGKDFVDGFLKDYDYRHQIKRDDDVKSMDVDFNERLRLDQSSLISTFTVEIRKQLTADKYNELKRREADEIQIPNEISSDQRLRLISEEIEKIDIYYPFISRLANKVNNFSIDSILISDDIIIDEADVGFYYRKIETYFQSKLKERFKMFYGKFRYSIRDFVKYFSKLEWSLKRPKLIEAFKKKAQKESEEQAGNEMEISVTLDMDELARLSVENVILRKEKNAYQTLADQRELEIRELKKYRENFIFEQRKNVDFSEKLKQLNDENATLMNFKKKAEQNAREEKLKYEASESVKITLINENKKLTERNEALGNDLVKYKSDNSDLKIELYGNTRIRKETENRNSNLEDEVLELKDKLKKENEENKKYKEKVDSLEKNIERSQELLKISEENYNELTLRHDLNIKKLSEKIQDLEDERDILVNSMPEFEPSDNQKWFFQKTSINSDESSSFEEQPDF